MANSYPGSEKIWALPGPSLCYLPDLHGLPDVQDIHYREPKQLVFGSFNHTRKLTRVSQQRFGEVLNANPDAVLQFRSHSFHDPAVRRRFLIRFQDMGIAPHNFSHCHLPLLLLLQWLIMGGSTFISILSLSVEPPPLLIPWPWVFLF